MKKYTNIIQFSTLVFLVNSTWYIVYRSCVRSLNFKIASLPDDTIRVTDCLAPNPGVYVWSRFLCPHPQHLSHPHHISNLSENRSKANKHAVCHVHSKNNRYWGHHFSFLWAIIDCPLPSHHCSSFLLLRRPSAPKSFLFHQHLGHACLLSTDYLWVSLERKIWKKIVPALKRFKILVSLKCLHIFENVSSILRTQLYTHSLLLHSC